MPTIIDGKKISDDIQNEIAVEVQAIIEQGGKTPHLAAILVGNDGASETYVAAKVKACERVGFKSTLIRLSSDTT
ncbi:MAG: bifunctional 5,10-methylene-tetrahydrofolate dehydrogenase/5,10-methylene-tetrahydrofolate cyclohydrolase, partial [Bacteroidetes bacterium]|nr:bifunctional 5,10-methylene-tetrahydrofolate dehydrogenase/5,10-methylene-tetrahydrofolate cyclohydrolase [Bacteroidota bacterium]